MSKRYRMPAEWAPHQATWVSWPHKEESWPGKIEQIQPVYAQMIAALAESEPVHINVLDQAMAERVQALLVAANARLDRVQIHLFPTNDAWCRDHGAIFVYDQSGPERKLVATDWGYNAWGNKYPPYDLDNQIPRRMAEFLGVERIEGGMILEGGSIDCNGAGVLLTTEQCLLNENRNPDLSKAQIEQRLREVLGVEQILWLGDGIVGDDTDGHVDDITRFVAEDTILTAVEEDPEDENYAALQENLARLQQMTDQHGKPFRIITIPMPPAVIYEDQRLPASYANFYIGNSVVLVPFYGHANDQRAAEIIQGCFPDRKVVGIDCRDIIWGLGAWHCLTQQIPVA